MTRPLYMFRPNLQNEEHRKAWEILQLHRAEYGADQGSV